MTLTWPWALTALLAFPLLLGFRWWTRRRRRRDAVRVPSIALIRAAMPGRSGWRRRIPLWLFAAGLVALAGGAARPQASVLVPSDASAILLAVDVSGSMCATDVAPNRLTVAQEAARDFIDAQKDGTKIGLVVFSGVAALRVPPTADKDELREAIGGLRTGRGTAIGLGILTAIDAIAEVNPDVEPTGVEATGGEAPDAGDGTAGDFEPDTIVVLTDGANTQGVDPVTAAQEAAARRLRVYTIGFGTTLPAPLVCTADQIGPGGAFGGGFGRQRGGLGGVGGGGRNRDLDEETLTKVADLTGAEYFKAEDADSLTEVLLDLPSSIVLQRKNVEIAVWFALAGALLVLLAVGLSMWWNRVTAITHEAPPGLSPGSPGS